MRVLLDTHTLLWWLDGDRRLSRRARNAIGAELPAILRRQNFESLPIAIVHALRAGNLPGPHRDPFDRMLIAQAQDEDLALVSNERVFDAYGVRRVW